MRVGMHGEGQEDIPYFGNEHGREVLAIVHALPEHIPMIFNGSGKFIGNCWDA